MKLIIGAPHGRSGKTTVTLGLILALRQKVWHCSPLRRGRILLILAGSAWWREEIAVTWIFILWSMKNCGIILLLAVVMLI